MKTVMLSIFHFATFDAVFSLITDNASENIRKKNKRKTVKILITDICKKPRFVLLIPYL